MHVPSLPFGHSSGLPGGWQPDRVDDRTRRLVLDQPQDGWQSGGHVQPQRLVATLGERQRRAALIVPSDFHAGATGRIVRTRELSIRQPVHTAMAGTLGAGEISSPSALRRVEVTPSATVVMEEALQSTQGNGIAVVYVTPERRTCRPYRWRPPQPVEAIDTMGVAVVHEIARQRQASRAGGSPRGSNGLTPVGQRPAGYTG